MQCVLSLQLCFVLWSGPALKQCPSWRVRNKWNKTSAIDFNPHSQQQQPPQHKVGIVAALLRSPTTSTCSICGLHVIYSLDVWSPSPHCIPSIVSCISLGVVGPSPKVSLCSLRLNLLLRREDGVEEQREDVTDEGKGASYGTSHRERLGLGDRAIGVQEPKVSCERLGLLLIYERPKPT